VVLGHARVEVRVEAVQNREPAQAEWTALRVAEALELDEQLPQVVDDLFFSRLRSREAGNLGAQTDATHTEQPKEWLEYHRTHEYCPNTWVLSGT
jgi:uncharacterized protein YgbK (DUF1537 family)